MRQPDLSGIDACCKQSYGIVVAILHGETVLYHMKQGHFVTLFVTKIYMRGGRIVMKWSFSLTSGTGYMSSGHQAARQRQGTAVHFWHKKMPAERA
jgi:hypothetical protein